ncbi:hypothetical protein IXB28_06695 [Leptothoe kymatousa TAU-MAC 1615]|uniref:Uncharacterized protein n=2 Tax=Leptothoe TaxID=2651725 RepID=A0ABS5Y231_9CYAN|nr:hypothetical protein [Leptothoe kymatousa TAU-MAC 1615]
MTMLRSGFLGSSVALSLLWGLALGAFSQELPSSHRSVADSLARLDRAICLQAWDQAIGITGELIASPDVSSGYRQELLVFRRQLQTWQLSAMSPTTQTSCDRTSPLYLTVDQPEAPAPQPLDWNRALASLNTSRPIIDFDDTYNPVENLIPDQLVANSPAPLADTYVPVDTTYGFDVIAGRLNQGPQVYSFLARRGDQLSLEATVTRSFIPGSFRLLLFDQNGRLLLQSDQSDFQTSVQAYTLPSTHIYFVALVPEENVPALDLQGQIVEWPPASNTSFDYTLTLTGVTPYQTLLP